LIQAEAEAVFGEDQVIGSHKISTEEVDVFIMPNICIEFNGIWHHRLKKRRTKDSQKLRKIQKLGHKAAKKDLELYSHVKDDDKKKKKVNYYEII
tara:strand:- start:84 stop:368 length:285 start_codon:yes stop_codon:yes gene_type:complete